MPSEIVNWTVKDDFNEHYLTSTDASYSCTLTGNVFDGALKFLKAE